VRKFVSILFVLGVTMFAFRQNASAQFTRKVAAGSENMFLHSSCGCCDGCTCNTDNLWHGIVYGNLDTYAGVSNGYGVRSAHPNTAMYVWSVSTNKGDEIPFTQNGSTEITVTFPRQGIYQVYCYFYSSCGAHLGNNWGEILVY
jgi:hypothetical protein